jgi:segregation and condensation protein A
MEPGTWIRTDDYEGPLERLLRLVEWQEIEAASLRVFVIIRQLVDCLAAASYSDIDKGGRYLLLAATLLALKARNLLPGSGGASGLEGGDGEMYGPEDGFALTARDEYLQIREAARVLEECARKWLCSYRRPRPSPDWAPGAWQRPGEAAQPDLRDDITRLVTAFQEIVKQGAFPAVYRVATSVNFPEVMEAVFRKIKGSPGGLPFRQLFHGVARLEAIYNFLAVLELVYQGRLRIGQQNEAGEIILKALRRRSVSRLPAQAGG